MRRPTTALLVGGLLAAVPVPAHGSTGGGTSATPPPRIRGLACRVDCVDAHTARTGSLVKLMGTSLATADRVRLLGRRGRADDVAVPIASASRRTVVFRVPVAAPPGRVQVLTEEGQKSPPSRRYLAMEGSPSPSTSGDAAAFGAAPFGGPASGVFPVRGEHSFGASGARFGARRSGHTHRGQDVAAPCGTPLVAARGGVVRWRAFQARAGHYIVIDGDATDHDDVYMHLERSALVGEGQRVATGERLGTVGATGDASGCHLHFELWTAPGWYEGGRPVDPLPTLLAWEAATGPAGTEAPPPVSPRR